jgi:hypothetical protein
VRQPLQNLLMGSRRGIGTSTKESDSSHKDVGCEVWGVWDRRSLRFEFVNATVRFLSKGLQRL